VQQRLSKEQIRLDFAQLDSPGSLVDIVRRARKNMDKPLADPERVAEAMDRERQRNQVMKLHRQALHRLVPISEAIALKFFASIGINRPNRFSAHNTDDIFDNIRSIGRLGAEEGYLYFLWIGESAELANECLLVHPVGERDIEYEVIACKLPDQSFIAYNTIGKRDEVLGNSTAFNKTHQSPSQSPKPTNREHAKALSDEAYQAMEDGSTFTAMGKWGEASKADPSWSVPYFNLAKWHFDISEGKGDLLTEAEEYLQKAEIAASSRRSPEDTEVLHQVGIIRARILLRKQGITAKGYVGGPLESHCILCGAKVIFPAEDVTRAAQKAGGNILRRCACGLGGTLVMTDDSEFRVQWSL
jgi:hypothetical protein